MKGWESENRIEQDREMSDKGLGITTAAAEGRFRLHIICVHLWTCGKSMLVGRR